MYSLLPTHIPSWCTVSFPVPWGQISGKSWGNPDGRPVLALHGMCEQCKPSCIPALSRVFTSSVMVSSCNYLPVIVTHLQGGWTMLAVLISSFPYFLKVKLVGNIVTVWQPPPYNDHLTFETSLCKEEVSSDNQDLSTTKHNSHRDQAQQPPCAFHPSV